MSTQKSGATPHNGKRPDLSIIIINWRMGHDVAGALASIEAHEHRCSIEVILVNKPSGDGTEELIVSRHPWVRLVSHDQFGIAEMRNVGIAHARGRYCLMLDADTELLPGCLDALVDFMDRHPSLGGCGGHTVRPNGELEYNVKRFYDLTTVLIRRSLHRFWPENPWSRRHLMKDKDHSRPFEGDWMAGACFCMRRGAIDQAGVFDEKYYFGFEDVDWCWRVKRAGWRIAYNPHARLIHKVQRLSDKGINRLTIEHLKSGLRFWWKVHHRGLNWAWPRRPPSLRRHPCHDPYLHDRDRPDLSVIIVNFNAKELLRDCLNSLGCAAPSHRIETIVVDNASGDGSAAMTAREFPSVKLIDNTENLGFTKANNQGIAQSSGRYVLLLNNDTIVHEAAFSDAIEYLDRNVESGAAGLKLLNEDGTLQLSCRRFPSFSQALFNRYSLLTRLFPNNRFSRAYLMTDINREEIHDVDWVSGACLMIRRAVLDEVGLLDERFFMYSEDVDYCYRVWEAGWRVTYLPFAEVTHLIGQSSRRKPAMTILERHKSMFRFYKKHYSRDLMILDGMTILMVGGRCVFLLGSHSLAKGLRGMRERPA